MKKYVLSGLTFFLILLVTAVLTRVACETGTHGLLLLLLHAGGVAAMFYITRAVFRASK